MKVSEFRKQLAGLPANADILISADEEMNTLFKRGEIAELSDAKEKTYIILGYSGTEIELDDICYPDEELERIKKLSEPERSKELSKLIK